MSLSSPLNLQDVVVAFDLDGTLVETAPDLLGVLNQMLAEDGLAPVDLTAARVLVGRGAGVMLERGFAASGVHLTEARRASLIDRFIVLYQGRIAQESRPYAGVEQALDRLIAQGARLVVCTNKRTSLSLQLLEELRLLSRFVAVIGADLAPVPKPDPSHVLQALEAAGDQPVPALPARAVMVGDSINDVASAKAAGVASIVVPFGYTEIPAHDLGADLLIDHYDKLVEAVETLMRRGMTAARAQ